MNIVELLKQHGMFAQEIKTRLQNKQITLNGEPLDRNSEIEFKEIIDAGEFVFNEIAPNEKLKTLSKIFGFENLFGSNLNILKDHSILRLSKKEVLILRH